MKEFLESKNTVRLDAGALLSCIKWYKEYQLANDYEGDADEYLDAFVALGGNADKTGTIQKNDLIEIIKIEFELTIDMVVSLSANLHHAQGWTFRALSSQTEFTTNNPRLLLGILAKDWRRQRRNRLLLVLRPT